MISEKIIPDTLFGLINTPKDLVNFQPIDTFYNYSFWLIDNGNGGFIGRIIKEKVPGVLEVIAT